MSRWFHRRDTRWEQHIEALDPIADCAEIVEILSNHVFPLDIFVATELAQLRTFTIPTISKLLHATRQYEDQGVKRIDDTKALLVEVFDPGLDSEAGQRMVEHLNQIHGMYEIANDDYLYTLSVFTVDVVEWLHEWGWRPMSATEQAALYELYRQLGTCMHIQDIPPTYDDMLVWRRDYEARAQYFDPTNALVAGGLLRAAAQISGAAGPFVSSAIRSSFQGDAALAALGLERPSRPARAIWAAALRLRQRTMRRYTAFQERRFWDTSFFRTYTTYPDGYDRLRLGPRKVLAALERGGANVPAAV